MEVIAVVVGLLVGIGLGMFIMKLMAKGHAVIERDLETALAEVDKLSQANRNQEDEISSLNSTYQKKITELAVLEEKYESVHQISAEKIQDLKNLKENYDKLRTDNEKVLSSKAEVDAQLQAEKESLAHVRQNLAETKEQHIELDKRYSALRDTNEKTVAELSAVQAELTASQENLAEARTALSKSQEICKELNQSESTAKEALATAEEKIVTFAKLETDIKSLRQENTELTASKSELETRLEEQGVQTQEKLQLLEESKVQLKEQFKNLANEIFEEKSQKFTEVNKEKLDALMNPFKDQIKDFSKKVDDTYDKDLRDRTSLKEQLKQLHELNTTMSKEANNLTNALKGEVKTQGNWGELILERTLEVSGLREGQEFKREAHSTDEEGKRYRPDVIVNLPDNKKMVIDSKVSLIAYERYMSATNEEERKEALAAHILSVKNHIKGLAGKNYESLHGFKNPGFILLFMPIEGAFQLACAADDKLLTSSSNKNIMIVSPSTLMITLRTVDTIWKYEKQNRNARNIAEQAGKLFDKFVGFVEDIKKVDKQLKTLSNSFSGAQNKLCEGRGNIVSQCQTLKEMGVPSSKELDAHLVEQSALVEHLSDDEEVVMIEG